MESKVCKHSWQSRALRRRRWRPLVRCIVGRTRSGFSVASNLHSANLVRSTAGLSRQRWPEAPRPWSSQTSPQSISSLMALVAIYSLLRQFSWFGMVSKLLMGWAIGACWNISVRLRRLLSSVLWLYAFFSSLLYSHLLLQAALAESHSTSWSRSLSPWRWSSAAMVPRLQLLHYSTICLS